MHVTHTSREVSIFVNGVSVKYRKEKTSQCWIHLHLWIGHTHIGHTTLFGSIFHCMINLLLPGYKIFSQLFMKSFQTVLYSLINLVNRCIFQGFSYTNANLFSRNTTLINTFQHFYTFWQLYRKKVSVVLISFFY